VVWIGASVASDAASSAPEHEAATTSNTSPPTVAPNKRTGAA